MSRKLCLAVLAAALTLGIATPSQASITISPSVLDFGTFAKSAPPGNLTASVSISGDETNKYVTGLKMLSGQASFYPSSTCLEISHPPGAAINCTVSAHYESESGGTGSLTGVIGLSFGPSEGETAETREVTLLANVTTGPPPVTTGPPGPAPPAAPAGHKPKNHCKNGRGKKKSRGCGNKGKHKGKR